MSARKKSTAQESSDHPEPSGKGLGPLSRDEFARLFQGSARILWTIAAGVLGSPSEADDVLQEACIQALGRLEQFQRGTSFPSWMGRFVRNVALNHVRKRVRREVHGASPYSAATPLEELAARSPGVIGGDLAPIDPQGRLHEDQASFDDRLLAELKEIAAVPRACLLLRSLLELSYTEISEALGIPEGTAMSHVHRTRNLLRQRLGVGETSSGTNGHARPVSLAEAKVQHSRSTIDAEIR